MKEHYGEVAALSVRDGLEEFVGRDGELADIHSAVRRAQSGEGGFRAYAGDPGIGKSSMLLALASAARRADVPVLRDGSGRLRALEAQARGGHAVALIDDLHRIDEGELPALERLLELTAGGLLLAVAYRPRQLPLPVAAILRHVTARWGIRRLAPLTVEETSRLLGGHPDAEVIHRDSEGVPLYAYVLADATRAGAAPLFAELAALPPAELAVAQAAAVLDQSFAPETLIAVSDLDPDATRSALDALVRMDIIRPAQFGPLLAFRHRTLATAAYQTLAISRRSALHLRADRELERRGAPAIMRASHIAHFFDPEQPGQPEHTDRYVTLALGARQALKTDPAAATCWLEAAEARLSPGHPYWTETQLLLAKARLHMGRLDDSRTTLIPLGDQIEAMLHTGQIERLLGRHPEAAALIRAGLARADSAPARVVGLCELSAIASECSEHADSDRLATQAALIARAMGDPLLECIAWGGAAWARTSMGDVEGGAAAVSAAARLADGMVDDVAVQDIDCLRLLGQSEMLLDRDVDARRHISRGVRLARRTRQRHVLPNLLKVLVELEWRLGRLDRAVRILDEVEPIATELGIIAIQTLLAVQRAKILVWRLAPERVWESVTAAERATGFAAATDSALTWRLHTQTALGETLILAGQTGHGIEVILAAAGGSLLPRIAAQRRVRLWEVLAEAAVAESDLARADEYATLAVEAVDRAPTDFRRGLAYRARAVVDSARGATASALAAGEVAAASFTAAGALLDLGRAHVVIASACIDAGRFEAAGDRLIMAGELARRCGSGRLSELVRAQLARLPQLSPRREWWAALTTREHDIALLAGQGLASLEIAAKLHLSVRTVDSHLGRVYRKLGLANRVALANLLNARA